MRAHTHSFYKDSELSYPGFLNFYNNVKPT